MSVSDRQNRLLVNEDWKRIYQSYRNADFQSYDFDNLRRTMINYLRENFPEDFNDYIETSEYIALIDLIAFLGQNLSFRTDLNARENFLETAERRESILRLARLISYNPKRNKSANGLLKIESVKTTENVFDSSGVNLNGLTVKWNDASNNLWFEQFIKILNSALPQSNSIGNPLRQENIEGIPTEQYRVNALNTDIPTFKFTKTIQGNTTQFEVVSTSISNGEISEEPPLPGNSPAFLYRDDGKGAGSSNTGFFMHFRQGATQTGDFSINNPVPNQVVGVDTPNINDSDVWLYSVDLNGFESDLWTKVDAVEGNNVIYNSLLKNVRKIYTASTRTDDRINLIFADGVFGDLPNGNFRVYYRTSANRYSNITPTGMTNIRIEIPYISRTNTNEKLTIGLALKYTVTNGAPSESNENIKNRAPATYYTQNRLITAEDYNLGPLGISQEIIKTKSLNRSSSGISRYFDLKDVTGKYSSTNLYANDGILYKQEFDAKTTFTFTTQADIEGVVYNTVNPILSGINLKNYYNSKYSRIIVTDLNAVWKEKTSDTNSYTGYLTDQDNFVYQVGSFTANNLRLLESETMLKFVAPDGFHFMEDNSLMEGPADHQGAKTYIWTKIVSVSGDGTDISKTLGPIRLNDKIPENAILQEVKPKLAESVDADTTLQMIDQIFAYNDFALRYDQENRSWTLILAEDIDTVSSFSLGKTGNTSGQNLDSSWLLYFKTNGEKYDLTYRQLRYVFESESEIKFYFDSGDKIYDPKSGRILRDKIRVLNINNKPDSLEPFTSDFTWNITDGYRDTDGYLDTTKIQVSFFDSDDDGTFDDIELFEEIISPEVNVNNKIIFQQKYITEDNTEDFKYFNNDDNTIIIVESESAIGATSKYNDGQLFYIVEQDVFKYYDQARSLLVLTSNWRAYTGRDKLKFHYVHVADLDNRIDPSTSNIIDTYILTKSYDDQTRLWLAGEIATKPLPPSSDSLFRSYGKELNKIKSISDEIIYHPVKYKPLFGSKAMEDLQVTFKIVKNPNLVINDNELKAKIIEYINRFFATDNWDFGDTFYFQELSTYIMTSLSPDIASIVIVPKKGDLVFGSLFEIKSEPDEIFISGATVSDVEIIDEITATKIKATGNIINSVSATNSGIQSSVYTGTSSSTGGYSY